MRKLILASVSAIALFGVAACSDTDDTTTQSVDPMEESTPTTPAPADDPAATPPPADAPAEQPAPAPSE